MTIRACEKELLSILTRAGVDSPGLCVKMLLEHVTGLSRLELALGQERELSPSEYEELMVLGARRKSLEPMAYIIGHKDFYEHSFLVSPQTLIPRPETELLVDLALEHLPFGQIRFLDAGCGSGNIGLSLLAAREQWQGLLMDLSQGALEIARVNARNIAPQALLFQGDMRRPPVPDESLDLLISNPPYIGRQEREQVMEDVLAFEPHSALFSFSEGLGHLKALAQTGRRCLKPGGLMLVEHGAGQRESLLELFAGHGFVDLRDYNDLAALPRCLLARRSPA